MSTIISYLKDPKKRTLTLFALYFIFFIFVFAVLNNAGESTPIQSTNNVSTSAINNYKNMKSFDYEINYINNGISNIITGTFYNKISLFTYNNIKYYYDDKLYKIENDTYYYSIIEYNVKKMFNDNLYPILDKMKKLSETTYNDKKIKKSYILDSNIFYNYYYELDSNYTSNINIEITEENNYISNIIIDLSNLNLELSKIEIKYSNINSIENLEFNKENYIYKE